MIFSKTLLNNTVMVLSFKTDRLWHTVQTLMRSVSALYAIPYASFENISLWEDLFFYFTVLSSLIRVFTVCYSICIFMMKYPKVWHLCLNFKEYRLQQSFLASENLGALLFSPSTNVIYSVFHCEFSPFH